MRRLAAALPPIVAVAVAWAALESPLAGVEIALAAAAAAALVWPFGGGRRRSSIAFAVAFVGVACIATRTGPWRALTELVQGIRDASTVSAPFDPTAQPALHSVVVVACFLLAAGVARAVAAERPLAAGVTAAVGVAWPATLVAQDAVVWGCVALGAALWPSLLSRVSGATAALGGAAVLSLVLAGAAVAGGSGLGPDRAHVEWRSWNPLGGDRARVGVRYVWDADYGGIAFPARPTVVLRVRAPRRALYWRASTLDLFTGDRWLENLYPVLIGSARRSLPRDALVPAQAARSSRWVRQEVSVEALDDDHLVASTQPMRVESTRIPQVFFLSGGVMLAPRGIRGGERYTVWSYASRPTPQQLAGSAPSYPDAARRYLDLGRARLPSFGEETRAARVEKVFADERYLDLRPYRALWVEARRLTAGTESPYLATLAIERWLRTSGGFVYDERPAAPPAGVPPLVDFALTSRTGYCQHFAGTMALMLRTLGIPSRVAVGFTSGRWSRGEWVVTDHQAHAWVEAWFAGHGWLPFDPTPGRGTFSAPYSFAGDSADAVRALGTGRFLDFSPQPTGPATAPPASLAPVDEPARSVPLWPLALLVLPLVAGGAILVLKRRRRQRRLAAADPRVRAAGIRLQLADLLADRGVPSDRGASLEQLAGATSSHLGVRPDALVGHALVARYAPLGLAVPAAVAATQELERVEAAIARRSGRRRTALAAVRPGSLLRSGTMTS